MDLVLTALDNIVLDRFYEQTLEWPRDNIYRQSLSLFALTIGFITVFYFSVATLSFHFLYDKEQMKHPKFLKNQVLHILAFDCPIVSLVFH